LKERTACHVLILLEARLGVKRIGERQSSAMWLYCIRTDTTLETPGSAMVMP
jgi:hypothetical protein